MPTGEANHAVLRDDERAGGRADQALPEKSGPDKGEPEPRGRQEPHGGFFFNPNRHLQVAKNLTEEFVRVRSGKEGDREAMVTALCARSFTRGVLVFFDHKAQAHRMKIIFGLLGLQA